jgi:hypothetical protein
MREVCAAKRDGEVEARCREPGVFIWWLRTLLDLRKLETADVIAAEKSGKGPQHAGYSRAVSCP